MLASTIPWEEPTHVWEDIVDEPMKAIYSAYRRDLGIGSRPAVVAIDLYNKVFAGGPLPPHELQAEHPSSCGAYAHAAVPHIAVVLAAAREAGIPVIHLTANRTTNRVVATNRRSPRGTDQDFDFYAPIAPIAGEPVIEKERASAFYGTQLLPELVMRGVDTLIVVGESTSGCVRASAVDGYSNGFHVVVVEDGVFDRSWLNHQVSLFDLHHKYADVFDSAHVIAALGEVMGTPNRAEEAAA
jgi:nicotinamidase-related amidase